MQKKFFPENYPRFFLWILVLVTYAPVLARVAVNPDALFLLKVILPVSNPIEYLNLLINFKTIDFQPVRDLTFFFDLWIFRTTGIVFFTTTNILLWGGIVTSFYQLIISLNEKLSKFSALTLASAFAVYPIFTQAVPWGMARKHILAVILLLWATQAFLKELDQKTHWAKAYILYLCACLSHPLTILWPVWCYGYDWLNSRRLKILTLRTGLYVTTIIASILVNYFYHSTEHFLIKDYSPNYIPEFFNLLWVLKAFLFDLKQIFFPYQLGFLYYPDWGNSWPGIVCVCLIGIWIFRVQNKKQLLGWLAFACIPLPISLSITGIIYDQYLIIVIIGIGLALAVSLREETRLGLCWILIAGWGLFSFYQVTLWRSPLALAGRNFENSPSCKSVITYFSAVYESQKLADPALLNFGFLNRCFLPSLDDPSLIRVQKTIILSNILFYERPDSLKQRHEKLEVLGGTHYYPQLILTILAARDFNEEEVKSRIKNLEQHFAGRAPEIPDTVTLELGKFCHTRKITSCENFLARSIGSDHSPLLNHP